MSRTTMAWILGVAALVGALVIAGSIALTVATPQSDGCGPKQLAMTGTVDRPPPATWEGDQIRYPVSARSGPATTLDDGVVACFARTPEGAVFAALDGFAQLVQSDTAVAYLEARGVDGAGKKQFLKQAQYLPELDDPDVTIWFDGFRLVEYDGETAVVTVAVTETGAAFLTRGRPDGSTTKGPYVGYLAADIPLRWVDGDWMMDLTPTVLRSVDYPDDLDDFVVIPHDG